MTRSRFFSMLSLGICGAAAVATVILLGIGANGSTPGDDVGVGRWGGLGFVVASMAFGVVGSLLIARVPANRVGWVLAVTGLAIAVGDLTYQYADQVLFGPLDALPGGRTAALLQNLTLSPTFGLVGLALLLFPDGRVPSPRWKLAVLPAVVGSALIVAGYALRPGPLDPPFGSTTNPIGWPGMFLLTDGALATGYLLTMAGVIIAALGLWQRSRRGSAVDRLQLRWVTLAATAAAVVLLPYAASYFLGIEGINQVRDVALGIALAMLPAAAGFAILRYRLYDIDVVVNRTLVYGALTAALGAVYLGSVLLLQLVLSSFTNGSSLAIAVSTLAVAALFRPARTRIQKAVDRRFFRSKYDAARTLEKFGSHLRDQVDLYDIGTYLMTVVGETVQPAHVSLWLRTTEGRA